MDEIEKIQRYIKNTGVQYKLTTPYQMNLGEMLALCHMDNRLEAICQAFEYGRAKGARSARAAQKREAKV